MTDRFKQLIVVLEKDIREDDAEALINAIRMMRGVLKVRGDVAGAQDMWAADRARRELRDKLWKALEE